MRAIRRVGVWTGLMMLTACGGTRGLLRKAEDYMEAGRYPAAVRTYERVLEKKPGEPRALVGVARAWMETPEPERALVPAQVAAETQIAGGQQVLIDALLVNGKGAQALDRALQQVKRREEADGKAPPEAWRRASETHLASGQLNAAVGAAEKMLEVGGGADAQALAAWTHARTGNCDRALSLAARAVTGAMQNAVIQAEAAAAFRLCGAGERAQGTASTARTLLAEGPTAWELSANRMQAGGDHEGALRRISRLRTVFPDNGRYARQLGGLWLARDEYARAEVELSAALKLAPYADSTVSGGVHYAQRQSEAMNPDDRRGAVIRIWQDLAEVRRKRSDTEGLAEALEELVVLEDSLDPARWVEVAEAWANAGSAERGVGVVQRAIDLAPDNPRAHFVAARIFASAGMVDRAVGHGRSAWAAMPSNPEIALLLGQLYMQRGEAREAVDVLKAAAVSNPRDRRVQEALRRAQKSGF